MFIYTEQSHCVSNKRGFEFLKEKRKTKTKQTKPKQIIGIFEFEVVQDSREQFSSFGKETPSCIPTVTNVSKDLALFAKRSSSILIESCSTYHVKGRSLYFNFSVLALERWSMKYYHTGAILRFIFFLGIYLAYRRKTRLETNLFKDAYNSASTKWKVTKLEKVES